MRTRHTFGAVTATLAVAALVIPTSLMAVVAGGKKAKSDCYAVFEGVTANKGKVGVECTDGDAACDADAAEDGKCTFNVQVCANSDAVPGCTPGDVTGFTKNQVKGKGVTATPAALTVPAATADVNSCADPTAVAVPVKTKRNGKLKKGKAIVKLKATSSGRPKADPDTLKLFCLPGGSGGGTTTTTLPPPLNCPPNPAGGPNRADTIVVAEGTDLDNGWTGTSFNFPIIDGVVTSTCLEGCDTTTNPVCTVKGPTGPGTANTETLGPPLALIAGGVAVCVTNRFKNIGPDGITGTINLENGDSDLSIDLLSDVHVTNNVRVCPQCKNSKCDDGPNKSKACTVHGTSQVQEALVDNKIFQLSRDCPPFPSQLLATLDIPLRPTTGQATTPGTGGSKPCSENASKGVPPQDNACGGSGCSMGPNCSGNACVSMVPDPANPAQMICVDVKGGLSQLCCNGNSGIPCHPTAPGGVGIVRNGRAVAGTPPWPDPTYPKTAEGVSMVTTFCEAATGSATVDVVTGLPGPGAVIFNLNAEVRFDEAAP